MLSDVVRNLGIDKQPKEGDFHVLYYAAENEMKWE
jgi:hypothetical protein